jgi:urease gamma subunit
VQAEMQSSLEAKRVQQGVWHVLCEVQVCATWDSGEQGDVWGLLH